MKSGSHIIIERLRRLVIGIRSRALDDLFDGFLNKIPVVCFDFEHLDTIESRDVHEHLPALPIRHKGYGNADAPEASGTANAMKIGLWIWFTEAVIGDVLLIY